MGSELKLPITRPTLITGGDLESIRIRAIFKYKGIAHTRLGICDVAGILSDYPALRFPAFFDRGIVCAGAALDELVNERYPVPPLLPPYPEERAGVRFMAQEIRAWYGLPCNEVQRQLAGFFEAVDDEMLYFTGKIPSLVDFAVLALIDTALAVPPRARAYVERLKALLVL